MKHLLLLFVVSLFWPLAVVAQRPEPPNMPRADVSSMTEADADGYGMWQESPNYNRIKHLGIRVVDMPQFRSFFAYYLPPNFEQQPIKRAIIAVHGTGGTAYAELQDEIQMAQQLGYAVVAVQMRMPDEPERNMAPRELYGMMAQAVQYLRRVKQMNISRIAYVGFSVGGAKSFQIAYQDRLSPHPLFSLIVNHSGFSKADTQFLNDIEQGRSHTKVFNGLPFAFYCGMKDEEWQTQQCEDMHVWHKQITALGGGPIEVIEDAHAGHMGYRRNAAYHERFMRWFMELTP